MIQVQENIIASIPCLEVRDPAKPSKHFIIAYHGWTKSKDESILMGMELAKQGFHVILPDGPYHGDRREGNAVDPLLFPKCLQLATEEFKLLEHYTQEKYEATYSSISVCGVSFGAIIAGMILAKYPQVKTGGILMGAPNLLEFLTYLLNQNLDAFTNPKEIALMNSMLMQFEAYDLSKHLKNIAGKSLFLWHANNDSLVPASYSQSFVKRVTKEQISTNIMAVFDDEGGHEVPYYQLLAMANFLWESTSEIEDKHSEID